MGRIFKNIWGWFNDKKTVIGSTMLVLLKVLVLFGVPIPPNIVEALELIGYSLTGIGLGHKFEKQIKKNGGIKPTINKLKKKENGRN